MKIFFALLIFAVVFVLPGHIDSERPFLSAQEQPQFIDIGMRGYDGGETVKIAIYPAGQDSSPLRIAKAGVAYSIVLVEPDDPAATSFLINTANDGVKALANFDIGPDLPPVDDGDPTTIGDCEELQQTVFESSTTYTLIRDIDCSATNPANTALYEGSIWENHEDHWGFRPLEVEGLFGVVLDGQGHKIINLHVANRDGRTVNYGLGLFDEFGSGGSVQNLVFENVDMRSVGGSHIGAITGVMAGSNISNVHVTGTVVSDGGISGGLVGTFQSGQMWNVTFTGNIEGSDETGGIAGIARTATVEGVHVNGRISAEYLAPSGRANVGGLFALTTSVNISNSSMNGSVAGLNDKILGIGGLVGDGAGTSITQSYAYVDVIGGFEVGGLAGSMGETSVVTDSYVIGDIEGLYSHTDVAGLIGAVGFSSGGQSNVANGYFIGDISIGRYLNGVLRDESQGTVSCANSYWDTTVSGLTDSDCGDGKTTREMLNVNTYQNWDFDGVDVDGNDAIWKQVSPTHYPCLQWMDDALCIQSES